MDTKEKTRKQPRKPAPQQERRRKAVPEEKANREARPRKIAEERPVSAAQKSRRRPEEASAPQQRRQRPVQQSAQQTPRRQRPVETYSRPASMQQEGNVRFTAPQGTGPRKSAPKMSVQEEAALRRQQRSKPQNVQTPPKKNALQHLISGTQGQKDVAMDAAERAELRRKQRAEKEEKKRRRAQRHDTPAIIYTQPQTFNRDRLLLQLLTVTAVVAAMVLAMSVFFKVKTITVAGAQTYSTQAVQEASGIQEGDNLLTFSKARASAQIRAKLSYVDNIRIGIKLPDTVIIYIEELDVAYAIESSQGDWWLINSDGRVVEQINSSQAANYTKVLGVTLDNPQPGSQAVAADFVMQPQPAEGETQPSDPTAATLAPAPLTVTGAQRLSSVLQILKALEANDIVGEAASVEVSDLEDITLWYGSRYEVLLGDTSRMEYKIACMNDAILQMSDYQSGILDVSFTNPNWIDRVGYTPFG